jgi:DNA polymerase III subunit epsilon
VKDNAKYEAMAAQLEATGDFRILRRLAPRSVITPPDSTETKLGIALDFETTGLDPAGCEIIEIGMVPFTFAPVDGRIFEIREAFSRLRQPSAPIPEEITKLTGITDEMVAGRTIDPAEVAAFVAPADLIVAHNAAFDRKFAERFCEAFVAKPWACSLTQVEWAAEGFEGAKLGYLLAGCGLFHGAHRAVDDCRAVIEILASPLPISGIPAMAKLIEAANSTSCTIWAENSLFEKKDTLKARGYRWNPGNDGRPKSWFREVPGTALEPELGYLRQEIYGREANIPVKHLTAFDRFSDRA